MLSVSYHRQLFCFNSRAHKGRDPPTLEMLQWAHSFNSRAHKGRDSLVVPVSKKLCVSIHAPTRGATFHLSKSKTAREFQFTRPQGARLNIKLRNLLNDYVSIHAPTRGATSMRSIFCLTAICFNSRAHKGRDLFRGLLPSCLLVSIHAPTRGATCVRLSVLARKWSFNSRAHKGRDIRRVNHHRQEVGFNSRAHKGRDLPFFVINIHATSFNSRAHKGRDCIRHHVVSTYKFQFTRPQGARL